MGRDQVRNLEAVKVVPTEVNEFDFHQNQENVKQTKATKGTKGQKVTPMRGATAKKLAAQKAAKKK